jgi:hypothetical protein
MGEGSATGVQTTAILIGGDHANTLFYGLIAVYMAVLTWIVTLLGNLILTGAAVVFFVGLAAYFYRMPNRAKFLLIIERVTPLVYALFLIKLMLF